MVPFGGGTSLEGQILSPHRGVSIDFKNMGNVLELNEKVRYLTITVLDLSATAVLRIVTTI